MTNEMVSAKYGIVDTVEWNCFKNTPTNETYLVSQGYRFMTGSYCTRFKLERYKILDSALCPFCEEEDDDLRHAILKCPVSQSTWRHLQTVMNKLDIRYSLQPVDLVFGVGPGCRNRNVINTIIIQIKLRIASPKSEIRYIEESEIYNIMSEKLQLERMIDIRRIARKIKPLADKRWRNIAEKLKT